MGAPWWGICQEVYLDTSLELNLGQSEEIWAKVPERTQTKRLTHIPVYITWEAEGGGS